MKTLLILIGLAVIWLPQSVEARRPAKKRCTLTDVERKVVLERARQAVHEIAPDVIMSCYCSGRRNSCSERIVGVETKAYKEGVHTIRSSVSIEILADGTVENKPLMEVESVFARAKATSIFTRVFKTGGDCRYFVYGSGNEFTCYRAGSFPASTAVVWLVEEDRIRIKSIMVPHQFIRKSDLSSLHAHLWSQPLAKRFRATYEDTIVGAEIGKLSLRSGRKVISFSSRSPRLFVPIQYMKNDIEGWADFVASHKDEVEAAKREEKWVRYHRDFQILDAPD